MIKYYLQIQTFSALAFLIFSTSCTGQVKLGSPKHGGSEQKIGSGEQAKLVKNRFSNEYQALSHNVHCGLQDRAGNLWFGTTGDGVYRFDGTSFVNFTEKDGLSNNSVWSILEDKTGNIWFGTADGICRYDGKIITKIPISVTDRSNLYFNYLPNSYPSVGNDVWSMMQDKDGIIWFGTNDGLFCYNGTSFTRFLDDEDIINNNGLTLKSIQCMLQDKKGTIWFGSGPMAMEGVCRYDGKSLTGSKPNGDGWIRFMLEDKRGNIWFSGRANGVFRYNGKTFAQFSVKKGLTTNGSGSLLEDRNGNIWFGGGEKLGTVENEGGIWIYDGRSFKNLTTENGFGKYSVFFMIEDRRGNIWLGTRNTGLYLYDGKTFTDFSE